MSNPSTILIVEDEQALNDAYKIILEKHGYIVHVAFDGDEALDILGEIEPNLILLDLRMPNMGGLEFLRHYKPAENHPDVKIIVFSNLDTPKEINEAYALGAQRYMLKAWASPSELISLIKDTLKGAKQPTPQSHA